MRVMVFVKATKASEAGELPSEQLVTEMGRFNEALVDAGVMQMGDGLRPSSAGKRVTFSGGGQTVSDGPFDATEEIVAGFWIWQVKSMDEALQWAKRCPNPMPGERGVLEIRPFYEAEDLDEVMTPEAREREERLRERLEAARRS
jgi:hypothetical protein